VVIAGAKAVPREARPTNTIVRNAGMLGTLGTFKTLPPVPPQYLLQRSRLESQLDAALTRRLTSVVADAGFGKSTLVGRWAARLNSSWYTVTPGDGVVTTFGRGVVDVLKLRVPDLSREISAVLDGPRGPDTDFDTSAYGQSVGAALCDALFHRLSSDLVLVLDDVHELDSASPSIKVIEALCRQAPSTFHLVLVSRSEPPFPVERLKGQGQVLEIAGSELAFTVEETEALLATTLPDGSHLAVELHGATGGWPAALRLTLEALKPLPPCEWRNMVGSVAAPGGPLYAYLAQEVFEREESAIRRLICLMAHVDRFNADLCETLGIPRAAETIAVLSRRGLFIEPETGRNGWYSLNPLLRDFVRRYIGMGDGELDGIHRSAANWFETNGYFSEAVRSLLAIPEHHRVVQLLHERGDSMLLAGCAEDVVRTVRQLPAELHDSKIDLIAAQALQVVGDWQGALHSFERAVSRARMIDPGVAWRMGLIHYLRGDFDQAVEVFRRAHVTGRNVRDDALLLAWNATVSWARGDVDACREQAARAFKAAATSNDDQALAAAHTALAMVAALEGDRSANDEHYLRALKYAERAGDVLQIIRIRTNRGSHHMEEGSYEDALTELEIAIGLADLAGFAGYRGVCLTNRGETRFHLGQLEEAISDLENARALYRRMESRTVCYALSRLGTVYRERGDRALARAAYEEAIALAEPTQDLQGLVPALAGLARLLVIEDPEEARQLAERALSYGKTMDYVAALLAAGWVALQTGDAETAAKRAAEADSVGRVRRDRAGLAEALELKALCATDPDALLNILDEAAAIWREIRSPIGAARVDLERARVLSEAEARPLAERVKAKMQQLGARRYVVAATDLLRGFDRKSLFPVSIRTLGGFAIVREGTPLPSSAWQSKKARDLLKMLLARRGHPTPREALMEALWPEGDVGVLANRLSVALATVRSVLDPNKRFDPGHFIVTDNESVGLRIENLQVDVESFLKQVNRGFRLKRADRITEAVKELAGAEAAYTGDFLEEDVYEDWAAPLREEARAAYLDTARTLAQEAKSLGDLQSAQRFVLRILEHDVYDEDAHLERVSTLVAARRHGEARRAYRIYCARMDEIDVEAAPFPTARPTSAVNG
jgi:ATP/maltotriose-dependent transcriptional regulator MalT/DNA-binding SARP family transcriptional activator